MKSPEPKNAEKLVSFIQTLRKNREVPEYFPSWHPQQLSFHFSNPKPRPDESCTKYLHLKKNFVKI
jgi:hypothetical protein